MILQPGNINPSKTLKQAINFCRCNISL